MAEGIGRLPLGHKAVRRRRRGKAVRTKVSKGAELARNRARTRLWEMRERYKLKVKGNEAEMDRRKQERRKSLNPTFVPLMPSREYARIIRNPTNWSSVPSRPKYSSVDPKPRIYGKRFEVWDKKVQQTKSGQRPKEYQEAAQKMAEGVAELQRDMAKRAKELTRRPKKKRATGKGIRQ